MRTKGVLQQRLHTLIVQEAAEQARAGEMDFSPDGWMQRVHYPLLQGSGTLQGGEKSEPVSFLITDCVSAVVALLPMRTIYRVVSPALDKVPHTQLYQH